MADLIFNGTTLAWDAEVYFNGTPLAVNKKIYLNGIEVWKKHPYEPGQIVFTYAWSNGSNINNFITTYYANYPLVFDSQPTYYQGSGNPDSRMRFDLAPGFRVSRYTQAQHGTDSDGAGAGNTGGINEIWVGNTVSGLAGLTHPFSISSSGNGGSSFDILYEG